MKKTLLLIFGWLLPSLAPAQVYTNTDGLEFATTNGIVTIVGYAGTNPSVTVPSTISNMPVAGIASRAFDGAYPTTLTISSGVGSIATCAFVGFGLRSITIPDTVSNIGPGAFECLDRLSTVNIDSANIPDYAFNGITSITSVTIGNHVANIGVGAFSGPMNGGGGGVEDFRAPSLSGITIPDSVTNIGSGAFEGCDLYSLSLGKGLVTIGSNAFEWCYSLRGGIAIPDSVTTIGDYAFYNCGFHSLTLGTNVTSIGTAAFSGPSPIYSHSGASLACYMNSVTLPASVTNVGAYAFQYCSLLANVSFLNGFTTIGKDAFNDCPALTNVIIGSNLVSIGAGAFSQCPLASFYFEGNPPTADATAFAGDSNSTAYHLPVTSGWDASFDDLPTAVWTASLIPNTAGPDAQTNGFGFTISWAPNLPVTVESCADLGNPSWQPLQSIILTNGIFYFSDPRWTNYPARFYRVSAQ